MDAEGPGGEAGGGGEEGGEGGVGGLALDAELTPEEIMMMQQMGIPFVRALASSWLSWLGIVCCLLSSAALLACHGMLHCLVTLLRRRSAAALLGCQEMLQLVALRRRRWVPAIQPCPGGLPCLPPCFPPAPHHRPLTPPFLPPPLCPRSLNCRALTPRRARSTRTWGP